MWDILWCVADEEIHSNEPIEADKPLEELRQEPYSLPSGFCWDSLDIDNPIVVCIMHEIIEGFLTSQPCYF